MQIVARGECHGGFHEGSIMPVMWCRLARGECHAPSGRGVSCAPLYTVLPYSGPIQKARGGCGAKAPTLAARPELFLVGRTHDSIIDLWVVPETSLIVTWTKHQHISESHRNSKPPSGGTITTDRCLTHIWDVAHSESILGGRAMWHFCWLEQKCSVD